MKTFKVGDRVYVKEGTEMIEGTVAKVDMDNGIATVYFEKPYYNLRTRKFHYTALRTMDETDLTADDYLDLMNLALSLGDDELFEAFKQDLNSCNTLS